MATEMSLGRAGLFFVIGPLRTGSSLMSRCLDDHPSIVCLCESEINRALFRDYFVELHAMRMAAHGLDSTETIRLLDRKRQDDVPSLMMWYAEAFPRFAGLFDKPEAALLGDKSPDIYRNPVLVRHLADNLPLIYTVRDPRAILASIEVQDDATAQDKAERWESLAANYLAWRPYLDRPNVLAVRYEDLVTSPEATMQRVYAHLGLPYSPRFLEPFPRPFPGRFLWTTAIDWTTGVRKDFDPSRIDSWKSKLTGEMLGLIDANEAIVEFMDRFGYGR